MKQPAVYIITNQHNTTLYIGVTSNLMQKIWQHQQKLVDGFSKKYNLNKLVWFEMHETMESAITKEKQMKNWRREWKENVINDINPNWQDLWFEINL